MARSKPVEKRVERTTMKLKVLKLAGYNPRKITPEQLNSLCASIKQFGMVEDLVVRGEDKMLVGGHQRVLALKHLLDGKYVVEGQVVTFELPGGGVPCTVLWGYSDKECKLLNLALNKISGEWDYTLLPGMLNDLSVNLSIDELMVTGFSASEITDYLDVYKDVSNLPTCGSDGMVPEPIQRSPKITLDFTTGVQRDVFKKYLAKMGRTTPDEPSGTALLRVLGLNPT